MASLNNFCCETQFFVCFSCGRMYFIGVFKDSALKKRMLGRFFKNRGNKKSPINEDGT